MSWRAAHRFVITPNLVVRKGLVAVVMYCTDYCGEAVRLRACVCVCVCRDKRLKRREFKSCMPRTAAFQTQGAQQDNCFLSKEQTQNMHCEFLIITSSAEKKKSQWTPPWILIWSCFMVAQLHDWNRFSAQNSLVKVNYKGYWNDGRCHDCHYIFFSHSELRCMKMINECLFINWCVCRKEGSKMALHS